MSVAESGRVSSDCPAPSPTSVILSFLDAQGADDILHISSRKLGNSATLGLQLHMATISALRSLSVKLVPTVWPASPACNLCLPPWV